MMPTAKITMNKIIVFSSGESCLMQKRHIQIKWFIIKLTFTIATDDQLVGGRSAFAIFASSWIPTTYLPTLLNGMVKVEWARKHSVGWVTLSESTASNTKLFKTVRRPPGAESTTNDQSCLVYRRVRSYTVTRVYTRTFQCLFSFLSNTQRENGWQWSEEEYSDQAWWLFSHRHRILQYQGAFRRRNEKDGRRNEQIQIWTHEQGKQQLLQEHIKVPI